MESQITALVWFSGILLKMKAYGLVGINMKLLSGAHSVFSGFLVIFLQHSHNICVNFVQCSFHYKIIDVLTF